jgi:hypothetical protein
MLVAESKAKWNANQNRILAILSPATTPKKYLDNPKVQGITVVKFDKYLFECRTREELKVNYLFSKSL